MATTLLRPESFGTTPLGNVRPEGHYDWNEQAMTYHEIVDHTFNGTQTFNNQGHPSDSDAD